MQHRRRLPLVLIVLASTLLAACTTATEAPEPSTSQTSPPSGDELMVERIITDAGVPRELVDLGDGVWLLSDQTGIVHVVDDAVVRPEPLLDLTQMVLPPSGGAAELGLAGFAIAPDFATSGVAYTYTTEPTPDAERVDVLRRWVVDPASLEPATAESTVLLEIPQTTLEHVGGELVFDDDGRLLIGVGAPTGSELAGSPGALQGSILRIVPTAEGYEIPLDNPWVSGGGLPEIFAVGYRNPFRLDWDSGLGLVVAEPMWVERSQQVGNPVAGSDAGYPEITAAPTCWSEAALPAACITRADGTAITPPVLEYADEGGTIVSGAMVLHDGDASLEGRVLVADWAGELLIATPGEAPWQVDELGEPSEVSGYVWDVAQDSTGNVYLMLAAPSMASGSVALLHGLEAP